jgi:hypothetical protein
MIRVPHTETQTIHFVVSSPPTHCLKEIIMCKPEHRRAAERRGRRYPSDLGGRRNATSRLPSRSVTTSSGSVGQILYRGGRLWGLAAFVRALQQFGWTDGSNIRRFSGDDADLAAATPKNWSRSRRMSFSPPPLQV